jgi:hypothetical protein
MGRDTAPYLLGLFTLPALFLAHVALLRAGELIGRILGRWFLWHSSRIRSQYVGHPRLLLSTWRWGAQVLVILPWGRRQRLFGLKDGRNRESKVYALIDSEVYPPVREAA